MSGSNRVELADSAFIHAENMVYSVDVSLHLIHTPASSLNERIPVLAHDLPDCVLNISNAHLGVEEGLLGLYRAIPHFRMMTSEDVLHSLLVQKEGLVPELEALAAPIPEGRNAPSTVVNQYRRRPRHHIVRVLAGRPSPAFSLVSEFRLVRRCAWKCRAVRPCCRRRCRQTAARLRAVEWALAGVLPGLGSGMVRGPYAGPATRAGCDPARNLNEWPPGLARRGPRPGEVGKAHGADRPHPDLRLSQLPVIALPSAWRSPGGRVRISPRFRSPAVLSLRGLVAGRPAVAEPKAGRVGGRAARGPRQRVALKT